MSVDRRRHTHGYKLGSSAGRTASRRIRGNQSHPASGARTGTERNSLHPESAVEIRGARAASWPWRRIMTARPPRIQRNLGQRDKPSSDEYQGETARPIRCQAQGDGGMTPTEIERSLSNPSDAREHAFQILQSLGRLLGEEPEDPLVLTLLIRALEYREAFEAYYPLLNALLRETGLYPYAEPKLLSSRDRLAFEFHRPAGSSDQSELVFHRVQAQVYWRLIEGENIILSAPTSFGKSLIIDALIDTGKYRRIALVVPTIALIDETRKRLSIFSADYKIVTHASQPADSSRGTIFVLT